MDELVNVITYLCMAKDCAIRSGLDHHFISEIDHLIATAEANMEEESDRSRDRKEERKMNCEKCPYSTMCNYPNTPCIVVEEENA